MIYVFPITIPPSTPQTAPVITPLPLTSGTLVECQIQVPSGVVALAHIQIWLGLHQLYPSNSEGSFATSNETIAFATEFVLDQPPYALTARAWNDDTVNPHTLTVRLVVLRKLSMSSLADEVTQLLAQQGQGF